MLALNFNGCSEKWKRRRSRQDARKAVGAHGFQLRIAGPHYSCRSPVQVRSRAFPLDRELDRYHFSTLSLDLDRTPAGPLLDRTDGPVQVQSRSGPGPQNIE